MCTRPTLAVRYVHLLTVNSTQTGVLVDLLCCIALLRASYTVVTVMVQLSRGPRLSDGIVLANRRGKGVIKLEWGLGIGAMLAAHKQGSSCHAC